MLTQADEACDARVIKRKIEIGAPLPGEGLMEIAGDLYLPRESLTGEPTVLFCLPGGGVNKGYFDLAGRREDNVYSFAQEMTLRGFIVVTFDPLGVGESSRPKDGFALTSDAVMHCQAFAMERVIEGLRAGTIAPDFPPLPEFRRIGVGHSMGAVLLILQQAARKDYDALVLLCFANVGLPSQLGEDAALFAQAVRERGLLVEIARRRFGGVAYPKAVPRQQADTPATRALSAVQDTILPIPAVHAMMPGSVRSETARIDVPVFLGVCEKDMTGPPHALPADYLACRDLTLQVLAVEGHHPFVSAGGEPLFDRLAAWANGMARWDDGVET
jgi:pimeloyl-ACP methyl ester carboxylesterase